MSRLLSSPLTLLLFSLSILSTSSIYSSRDSVEILDSKTFRQKVIKSEGIWIVEFYAPWCGHCQQLAPEWKKAAKALKGIVHIAAVDCDQHKDLAATYQVKGFPTIKIFGLDKDKPTDYQHERKAKPIVDAALSQVSAIVRTRLSGKAKKPTKPNATRKKNKKNSVIRLTGKNFDDMVLHSGDVWLVEFYAPWCGHCKKLEPEYAKAAAELKGSVRLGAVDATANEGLAAQYEVKGYPTIKVFGPNAAGPNDAESYEGQRSASAIVAFGFEKFKTLGGSQSIKEIHSQETLETACQGISSCVIAFLPPIRESGKVDREKNIETLRQAARLVSDKPFRFAWIQGNDHPDLERAFDLPYGYPSIVAIHLSRKRYVIQRGAFSSTNIASFLQALLSGRETTISYESLPKLNPMRPWDGKDVEIEVIEEDDDDDIMNEILGNKDEL